MTVITKTFVGRAGWTVGAFVIAFSVSLSMIWRTEAGSNHLLTDGELMTRLLLVPAIFATFVLTIMSALFPARSTAAPAAAPISTKETAPFIVQVVGVQWLNPFQRRDYPTEWQLLWTLGLAKHNQDDDLVKENPDEYRSVQAIASVAVGDNGNMSFDGYHDQYLTELTVLYRDIYFSDSKYFYNAHSLKDKFTWRELAGIRVEYALPVDRFDLTEIKKFTQETISKAFDIGNTSFPNAWTRSTPPDVRITIGGPNAGFTSLTAGLDYLKAHPTETVWVMNWDAPSRPKDRQINENMVQLILAGPDYKTERAPLAWLAYPSSSKVTDFESQPGSPSRTLQAWKAVLNKAVLNAGKQATDIGYTIHDAGNTHSAASDRLAILARTLTEEIPEFDFMKQTFNTSALLGDMGAGSALTNVALGIAYANHIGKTVLVAGTTDDAQPIATIVVPPKVVRPIDPSRKWFRARGGNHVYLPWWGLRYDNKVDIPGFSR